MSEVLERFHRALIEEIQTQRPDYLTSPFTVAEIYQTLVPYGSHRDRIGVEMNGDYEDALVRLLAGEGGYLLLDSEPALRNLRKELELPNPNTGVYREFSAVDVRLNQAYLDLSMQAMDELPDLVHELEAEDPVGMEDLAPTDPPSATPMSPDELGIVPPGVDIFADSEEAPVGNGDASSASTSAAIDDSSTRPRLAPEFVEDETPAPAESSHRPSRSPMSDESCNWCRAGLPDRDDVNYCPYCGTDVLLVPCSSCGVEVEPEWRFCAACGTEASD